MSQASVQPPSDVDGAEEMALESAAAGIKYGERQIAEGRLTLFANPRQGRRYDIHITLPEFTCKCPFSGYPDFATIAITYIPDQTVVELKSLKLYINSYRDRYISHEAAVNQILDDVVAAADPLEIKVKGDFAPRGNVHTVIEVCHQKALPC
jgi:7-cyano-7-deazaguanine reductase